MSRFMKWLACPIVILWLPLAGNAQTAAHDAGLALTALDRYVRAADDNYRYQVLSEVQGESDGEHYRSYIVQMVSQQWLTETEVDKPVWEHYMVVTVPETVSSHIGFLFIAGGRNSDAPPAAAEEGDIRRALLTDTVVTTLYMVPNQPLVFSDDGRERREDAIIAYTWDKHIHTGDDKWPLRLPMTKAAVRAMDTVTDLLASDRAGNHTVNEFVVAGGSKRGWTTWTTAIVDRRVVAIIPLVIDLLNVGESFKHHFSVYGSYSLAIVDYVVAGNISWIGTPEWERLMDVIEPYEYRDRLTLPKYLVNSTLDEFFLPDSWQFYWHDLVGEKHLRYVPNANHGMADTDVIDSVDAWYNAIVHNISMPSYNWDVADDGTITLFTLDEPTRVLLWQATNPDARNFTLPVVGRAYVSSELQAIEEGVYKVKLDPPQAGYTAYFVEVEFANGTVLPFKFSSGVKIVPDVVEHQWQPSR